MKKARSGHSELSPCAHHEAPADAGIGRLSSCDFRAADFCLSATKHISHCICTEISMESILRRAQDKVRKILRELCKWKGAPIIEAEVCRDPIYICSQKYRRLCRWFFIFSTDARQSAAKMPLGTVRRVPSAAAQRKKPYRPMAPSERELSPKATEGECETFGFSPPFRPAGSFRHAHA